MMRDRLIHIWQHQRALLAAFVIAALLTLFFAVRMVVFSLYWADPAHRFQPLEPWMPLRYVSRSWQIPPGEIARALSLPPGSSRHLTMEDIARLTGLGLDQIEARLKAMRGSDNDTNGGGIPDGGGGG